jgi:hypothetical protein
MHVPIDAHFPVFLQFEGDQEADGMLTSGHKMAAGAKVIRDRKA